MFNILFSFLVLSSVALEKYDQVVETARTLQTENPATTQLFVLGSSDAGQPIVGLKIGDGARADLIVATHHGNEYGSTAVAMAAAKSFAQNPLPGHTVYVVPVLNISGYNASTRKEKVGGRWIDQNRDYPGPCGSDGPFRSKSTAALAKFIDEKNIVSSATLHTSLPGVLYPWGMSTKDISTAYDSTFISLARAATVESRYQIGNSNEVLYAADGAFEDYAFWKHGIWSLLFELGTTHSPSADQVQDMIATNVPGLRRFFEIAPAERAADHAFKGTCDRWFQVRRRVHLE